MCYFMKTFVTNPRHGESSRGYIEHLLPLYNSAAADSPLVAATAVTALASTVNPLKDSAYRTRYLRMYGKTLGLIYKEISKPSTVYSDHLLMAVLLLGLYEVRIILCTIHTC